MLNLPFQTLSDLKNVIGRLLSSAVEVEVLMEKEYNL